MQIKISVCLLWSKYARVVFFASFLQFSILSFHLSKLKMRQRERKTDRSKKYKINTILWWYICLIFFFKTESLHRWTNKPKWYTTAIVGKRIEQVLNLFYCRQFLIKCSFREKDTNSYIPNRAPPFKAHVIFHWNVARSTWSHVFD